MKTLYDFIVESKENSTALLFENCFEGAESLQDVFEAIGDKFIESYENNDSIDEGFGNFFRKLAGFGDKVDTKASEVKQKLEKVSSDVKAAVDGAIETTKKKAGENWDNIKDAYTAVVADVAAGIDKAKDAVANVAKAAGQKFQDTYNTVSTVVANGVAAGNKAIQDALNTPIKMAAVSTLIAAAAMCQKSGVDILQVLVAAGVK